MVNKKISGQYSDIKQKNIGQSFYRLLNLKGSNYKIEQPINAKLYFTNFKDLIVTFKNIGIKLKSGANFKIKDKNCHYFLQIKLGKRVDDAHQNLF